MITGCLSIGLQAPQPHLHYLCSRLVRRNSDNNCLYTTSRSWQSWQIYVTANTYNASCVLLQLLVNYISNVPLLSARSYPVGAPRTCSCWCWWNVCSFASISRLAFSSCTALNWEYTSSSSSCTASSSWINAQNRYYKVNIIYTIWCMGIANVSLCSTTTAKYIQY